MATRLGLGLPQMQQYDIGRDVPDGGARRRGDRLREPLGLRADPVPRARPPGPVRRPGPPLARPVPLGAPTRWSPSPWPPPPPSGPGSAPACWSAPLHVPVPAGPHPRPRWTRRAAAGSSRASARAGRSTSTRPLPWPRSSSAARSWTSCSTSAQAVWGPDPVAYEGELTTIAPAVVGPKPAAADPGPAAAPTARRRTAPARSTGRTAGCRSPWAPRQLAAQWQQLQDLAAERGRKEPIQSVLRVNAASTRRSRTRAATAALPGQRRRRSSRTWPRTPRWASRRS